VLGQLALACAGLSHLVAHQQEGKHRRSRGSFNACLVAADSGHYASKQFICTRASVSSFLHDKGFLWGAWRSARRPAGEVEVEVATAFSVP